uniref:Uncharacterized protein n=1 Tax=Onchocerca volvulus TaxID=6282 RepID=A0A8R1TRW1_ONCVO
MTPLFTIEFVVHCVHHKDFRFISIKLLNLSLYPLSIIMNNTAKYDTNNSANKMLAIYVYRTPYRFHGELSQKESQIRYSENAFISVNYVIYNQELKATASILFGKEREEGSKNKKSEYFHFAFLMCEEF